MVRRRRTVANDAALCVTFLPRVVAMLEMVVVGVRKTREEDGKVFPTIYVDLSLRICTGKRHPVRTQYAKRLIRMLVF